MYALLPDATEGRFAGQSGTLERPSNATGPTRQRRECVDRDAGLCHHSLVFGNERMFEMKAEHSFNQCTVVCFNRDKIAALRKQLPSERDLRVAARRHKVLGHLARQAILHTLTIDECCVCDIAAVLDKPVSTVSQHLRALASAGLLDSRQEGKLVFYSLSRDGQRELHQLSPLGEATG